MTVQPDLPEVPPKPRKPRRMLQPRKAWLRAKLRDLTEERDTLRAELEAVPRFLRRMFNRRTKP
jgi:hypothetical protein